MRDAQPAVVGRFSGWATANRVREYGALAVLSLVLTGLLALRTELMTRGHRLFAEPGWDHHAYIGMAEGNPFGFHIAPFGWRVGLPAMVKVLPFGTEVDFLLVTFVAVASVPVLVYLMLRSAGVERVHALTGAGLVLSLGWAVKFALMDFWLTDGLLYALVMVALVFAVSKRSVGFAVALVAGVLVKEAALFVAPLFYTLQTRQLVDRRLALRTVVVAFPAVVALVAVRLLNPAENGDAEYVATLSPTLQQFSGFIPSYSYYDSLRDIGWYQRAHDFRFDTWLLYTTGSWGVGLLALAAVGAVRSPRLALRLSPLVALAYGQILVAENVERLIVLGFPVMVWLAVDGLRGVFAAAKVPGQWAWPLAAVLFALQFQHPATVPVRFEAETLVLLAWLVVVVGLRVRRVGVAA